MRAAGLVLSVLVGTSACVPADDLGFPVDARSYLLFEVRDGPPVSVVARMYMRGDDDETLVVPYVVQSSVFVLGYDGDLRDLAVEADAEGLVALAEDDAPDHSKWTIPTPKAWAELEPESAEPVATGGPSIPAALQNVRLVRPECPAIRQEMATLDYAEGATSMVPFGPKGMLVGRSRKQQTGRPPEVPPGILYLEPGMTAPRLVPPPEVLTATRAYLLDALFYRDTDQLRVVWGSNQLKTGYTYAVEGTEPTFTDRQPLWRADDTQPIPTAIAAHTFSSTRTVVIIHYATELAAQDSPPDGRFYAKGLQPAPTDDCSAGTSTNLLVITGPGQGIVALKRDGFRTFDLAQPRALGPPYGPESAGITCRSSRVVMRSGDELLSWSGIPTSDIGDRLGAVAWRRTGEDDWTILPSMRVPSGAAMAVKDELVFVTAGADVAVYQREPKRPELPPRHCVDIPVRANSQVMGATAEAVLVGGPGGDLVWLTPE